eukprot:gnl/Chilomastix_cuspidata/569.p1 GENE.gnl/Chilomastix_cuspidata/569~~gnl/Chilomastix_cuspidata/569.p1  ORF type:complete len:849 (+),score=225.17 gnl/Chilomastix_cuspidata/569:1632-4178(+)
MILFEIQDGVQKNTAFKSLENYSRSVEQILSTVFKKTHFDNDLYTVTIIVQKQDETKETLTVDDIDNPLSTFIPQNCVLKKILVVKKAESESSETSSLSTDMCTGGTGYGYSTGSSFYSGYSYGNRYGSGYGYGYQPKLAKPPALHDASLSPAGGRSGLRNLGNTCFMNSGLQCLLQCLPLTKFMLTNDAEKAINEDNPLGSKGAIARAYGKLVREVWAHAHHVTTPSLLKSHLGKAYPQFSGYGQQDSHELLTLLLDKLHEDFNRIRKKPMTEQVTCEDDADFKTFGTKAWDVFKLRDDSVVVDNFYGLVRNRVRCLDCGKTSVTFQPLASLQLPIPPGPDIPFPYIYIPRDPRKKAAIGAVQVPRENVPFSRITSDIKQQLGLPSNTHILSTVFIPPSGVVESAKKTALAEDGEPLRESDGSSSDGMAPPASKLSATATDVLELPTNVLYPGDFTNAGKLSADGDDDPVIIACETDFNPTDQKTLATIAAFATTRTRKYSGHYYHSTVSETVIDKCSLPFVLTFQHGSVSEEEMEAQVAPFRERFLADSATECSLMSIERYNKNYSPLKPTPPLSYNSYSRYSARADEPEKPGEKKYRIPQMTRGSYSSYFSKNEYHSEGRVLFIPSDAGAIVPIAGSFDAAEQHESLTREAEKTDLIDSHSMYSGSYSWSYTYGSSSYYRKNRKLALDRKEVLLNDCLSHFLKPSIISGADQWYCPDCKEHKDAELSQWIFSPPPFLIVQLKRFKARGSYGSRKVETFVDYPIDGWDIKPFIDADTCHVGSTVYDLIAVSIHMGGLGGGHYIAYTRHAISGEWLSCNDSSVHPLTSSPLTKGGYVLFYKRRDVRD